MTDLDRLKRGDRVVIPKGTPFAHATAPGTKQAPKQARTTHTVKLVAFDREVRYQDYEVVDGQVITKHVVHPARIWWAGPGGYWRVVEVTDALREANQ